MKTARNSFFCQSSEVEMADEVGVVLCTIAERRSAVSEAGRSLGFEEDQISYFHCHFRPNFRLFCCYGVGPTTARRLENRGLLASTLHGV